MNGLKMLVAADRGVNQLEGILRRKYRAGSARRSLRAASFHDRGAGTRNAPDREPSFISERIVKRWRSASRPPRVCRTMVCEEVMRGRQEDSTERSGEAAIRASP